MFDMLIRKNLIRYHHLGVSDYYTNKRKRERADCRANVAREFIKERERNVEKGQHLSAPNKSFLRFVVTDNPRERRDRAKGSVTKTESGCHLTREGESL